MIVNDGLEKIVKCL